MFFFYLCLFFLLLYIVEFFFEIPKPNKDYKKLHSEEIKILENCSLQRQHYSLETSGYNSNVCK